MLSVVLAAPGTALAGPAPVAVSIAPRAPLNSQSAVVTVIYRCPLNSEPNMIVTVQQGVSNNTSSEDTGANVCDGTTHRLRVDVPGGGGLANFHPGKASASATLDTGTSYGYVTAQRTVTLVKAR